MFGVGKRGDPLPKPKHLTLTPSSGTLVLVSRGVKDSACTAGLAGTHACGGECKSKHEWNRGGQSPRKQEDLPRERRNPLSFRHGEDVNPLLYEYPDWALLSVGASLPRWTHVGAPGYWTATETDAWLRRTFIPQVQALEPTDQLTDPRYRVAQALAPDVFAAWASQRALAPPPLSRGYLPLHLVEQPHALIPYVEVIRHWLADYPAGRIPAMWVQAYYTAIATTASQAHPVICASHAFTRMYEAIGLGTHDCSSGWHMLHASFQEVSTCLWGHVQRVTTMLYEDTTCAELLSELLLLLLAQAGASQYEHMASVRHAIRPLWEQARFDERYVFPAMREQGTGA